MPPAGPPNHHPTHPPAPSTQTPHQRDTTTDVAQPPPCCHPPIPPAAPPPLAPQPPLAAHPPARPPASSHPTGNSFKKAINRPTPAPLTVHAHHHCTSPPPARPPRPPSPRLPTHRLLLPSDPLLQPLRQLSVCIERRTPTPRGISPLNQLKEFSLARPRLLRCRTAPAGGGAVAPPVWGLAPVPLRVLPLLLCGPCPGERAVAGGPRLLGGGAAAVAVLHAHAMQPAARQQ